MASARATLASCIVSIALDTASGLLSGRLSPAPVCSFTPPLGRAAAPQFRHEPSSTPAPPRADTPRGRRGDGTQPEGVAQCRDGRLAIRRAAAGALLEL